MMTKYDHDYRRNGIIREICIQAINNISLEKVRQRPVTPSRFSIYEINQHTVEYYPQFKETLYINIWEWIK